MANKRWLRPWNHNIHYHDLVLSSVPTGCRRALDAGCGQGLLTRRLATCCAEVTGIDTDRDTLVHARSASEAESHVTFIEGDVIMHPFPDGSFDFITAVAALHHLPLRPALLRFKSLLRSGGTLSVIGLYRTHTFDDYLLAAIALPSSWILGRLRAKTGVGAPVQNPVETLNEIRSACAGILPGAIVRRHLLFRYSLIWRKP